jgi:ADP-ribose pyrophosphatase YjhB (NUDIX family)
LTDRLPLRTYDAAGGVVVEPDREQVLVLLRPVRQDPGARPEVRLPKGHVEPGEKYSQTAIREVEEETGLSNPKILADLGRQTVEFDWQGHHYVRQEFYFLMAAASATEPGPPEEQFERRWLTWDEALARLTFEAEREWVRRGRAAWAHLIEYRRSTPPGAPRSLPGEAIDFHR